MKRYLPESGFLNCLIRINNLHALDFSRLIFFPGMLFGSEEKWWGKRGRRSSLHEGLDLCFFENTRGQYFRLDESVKVPMLYNGRVEHITDDFLGKTVIASHRPDGSDKGAFLSLYGHLNPDKNLQIGDEINEGQIFANIHAVENKQNILLPHLHISLAKADRLPPAPRLEWEFLNSVDRSVFINPVDALAIKYLTIEYDDTLNLSEMFTRCSRGIVTT